MLKNHLIVSALIVFLTTCSEKEVYSSKECRPVVSQMLEKIKQNSPEKRKELEALTPNLIPMMEKMCKKGDYHLKCLQHINKLETIQFCKKKRK